MKSKPLPEILPFIAARFWSKVDVRTDSECWPWKGGLTSGYGHFRIGQVVTYSHRVAYQLVVGPAPWGEQQLDHLCRNRVCCNPAHMEEVTPQINILRGHTIASQYAKRTHCSKGHLFAGTNLYWKSRKNHAPSRVCLTCRRAAQRVLNAKYRAPGYTVRRKT